MSTLIAMMDVRHLVQALLSGDLLAARQWVIDAERTHLAWSTVECPPDLDEQALVVAAAVVELLASRVGDQAPSWTQAIGGLPEPLILDPGLSAMPRSLAWAMEHAPEPFRRRNIFTAPDFLRVR